MVTRDKQQRQMRIAVQLLLHWKSSIPFHSMPFDSFRFDLLSLNSVRPFDFECVWTRYARSFNAHFYFMVIVISQNNNNFFFMSIISIIIYAFMCHI